MKVIGYMPILYGKEYLEASLKSVEAVVDKFVVLYTPVGSQGYSTDIPCPDTEGELYDIAYRVLGSKLVWDHAVYRSEGQHRDAAFAHAAGFDVLVAVDSDEVFHPGALSRVLDEVYEGPYRAYGVAGYLNFWRSFNEVCTDGFRPIRFFNLRRNSGQGEVNLTVYHFSYAQSDQIAEYKWRLSGHRSELRPEWKVIYDNWLNEKAEWLHPVSRQIWQTTTPFDKTTLPDFLKLHPNYNKEIIR